MKIEQLLLQPHGQKIGGGFTLSIKTRKKEWTVGKVWWQQLICMDETGEMPVDVKLGRERVTLRTEIKVIVAEVRDAEYLNKPRKILVVDQFSVPTIMVDDYYAEADKAYDINMAEVRGKIRHGLVCSFIQAGKLINKDSFPASPNSEPYTKKIINEWAEFIITGK